MTTARDALEAALEPLGKESGTVHKAAPPPIILGTDRPSSLEQIRAYRRGGPTPHWHFVTLGLSELDEKVSGDEALSGWGFELTLRAALRPGEERPPGWPIHVLNFLADQVFESGTPFGANHYLALHPLPMQSLGTRLEGVVFRAEPELATLDTPNGRCAFLQVVGVTLDELELVRDWSAAGLLEELARPDPALVTRLERTSLLQDPSRAAPLRARVEREGSSTEIEFTDRFQVKFLSNLSNLLVLEPDLALLLARLLHGRLRLGRTLELSSRQGFVHLAPTPAAEGAVRRSGQASLKLEVPVARVAELEAALRAGPGKHTWPWLSGLEVERRG